MDTTASLAFAGALAPLLIASVTRAGWSATTKRWIAISVSATLTGLVWALTRYPESVSGSWAASSPQPRSRTRPSSLPASSIGSRSGLSDVRRDASPGRRHGDP